MAYLNTIQVREMLYNPNVKLIDIRSADAYNGWRLNGEMRGGHISSAKSLPSKWLRYLDWIDIVRSKNIHPAQKIIVYGSKESEIKRVPIILSGPATGM